jgi:methyl-accepting chemotaxis protein
MTQHTAALQHKLETDSKATVDHLGEVNRSVGTVVKTLETVSETVMARIEEQDRRLDAVVDSLELMTKRVNQLQPGLPPAREAREVPKAAGSKRESDGFPEHRRQPASGSDRTLPPAIPPATR